MKNIRKWLIRIGIVLLVIVIVLAGVGTWFVRRPWPQVSGTLEVAGPLAPVEVIRDQWGVPHVYAQNEHDLFFAQGYVHAQDRLWQMEMHRRLSNGTLSEILGEPAVKADRFFRTVGLHRLAEQSWPKLDSDNRAILEVYAEGVNTYIDTHRNRLPLEFTILGIDPKPWTPVDSLTWGNFMSIHSGFNAIQELMRAKFIAELGEETAQQILPLFYETPLLTLPAEASSYDWLQGARHFEGLTGVDEWLGKLSWKWGSNNWVVHGSHTEAGMPILANDPHIVLEMPSLWYENGLHGGRFDSVGFTLPGVPLVIIGHNRCIAWGITNTNADVQDMYIEKLDDVENPTQYKFMGEWHDIDVIQEVIEVKGSEPVKMNILLTRHGPIVHEMPYLDWFLVSVKIPEPMAFRWSVDGKSNAFEAIVLLNLAANWDEFRAALQRWDTLSQNFVFADVEGSIGYQATGKIPIRAPGYQGVVPVPGWTGEYEWQGFIPFDELPSVLNPPEGFIVTANNKVVSDDYPHLLTYEYLPGYRARRITDLLSTGDHFTVEDMQDIQDDTYSVPAGILRPYLLAVEPENDLQAEALAHLEAWDLYYETDSVGASIYETWCWFLIQNTVGDEYGEWMKELRAEEFVRQVLMMIELLADADSAWFDDVNTPEVETRDDIVRRSLTEAVDWLSERCGKDPSRWKLGRVQTITFRHSLLGYSGIAPVERLVNSKAVPVRGSMFSVSTAWYTMGWPFEVIFGPVLRMIADVSDWDNTLAVLVPGQSGHLFHPHGEDQISMWQNNEYHPMLFSREAVEKNAEAVLTLTPQQ